jgi:N-acetylneuraminic acid mutarotase
VIVEPYQGSVYIGGGCNGPQNCDADSGFCACSSYTSNFLRYTPSAEAYATLAPLPRPRYRHASAVWRDALYLFGGRSLPDDSILLAVDVYNFTTATWATLADAPASLPSDQTCFVLGDAIHLAGGYSADYSTAYGTVWTYLPANDTWSTTAIAPMNTTRGDVASAVVNGLAYVYGGYSVADFCTPLRVVEEYDPRTNTWARRADLLEALAEKEDAVVLNGRIYTIGGETKRVATGCIDKDLRPSRNVYSYDPVTNTWRNESAILPDAHFRFGACALNGALYVVGGQGPIVDNSTFPILYSVYSFDAVGNTGAGGSSGTAALSGGAVAGVVIGVLVGVVLAGWIGFRLGLRRGQERAASSGGRPSETSKLTG